MTLGLEAQTPQMANRDLSSDKVTARNSLFNALRELVHGRTT